MAVMQDVQILKLDKAYIVMKKVPYEVIQKKKK